MIFVARGIMVSLAFFALLYTFLSLLLALAWRWLSLRKLSKHHAPDVLFMLRVAPFAVSAVVSLFLICPSFVVLETHSMDEDLGTFVLGISALLFLSAGLFRVLAAEARTRRIVTACLEGAANPKHDGVAYTTISPHSVAPLMLVGIRVPRILISQSTHHILSEAELVVAVRHETEHLRARDNLKKAILNFLPFPGIAGLGKAWQEAAELAADDGAVSSRKEALDLAATLIKLSRHSPHQTIPDFATSLISGGESTTNRVERLLTWKKPPHVASNRLRNAMLTAGAISLALAMKLGTVLALIHSITERFVP
jgi:beta-lactamase regulating signal transducer with metallopeptidase domain